MILNLNGVYKRGYALAKIMATRLCQYIRRENPAIQYKTIILCNLFGRHDKFDPKTHIYFQQ